MSPEERATLFAKDMLRARGHPHWHDLRDAYLAGRASAALDADAIVTWLENTILPQRLPGRVRVQLREKLKNAADRAELSSEFGVESK